MAEIMSPKHIPDKKLIHAYEEWADGGWGMILTGQKHHEQSLIWLHANHHTGNVQVSDSYMGTPMDVSVPSNPPKDVLESWKTWASASQSHGTPAIVQLCHPGRQSPALAGNRGIFAKTIAPSAVKMDFGPGILDRLSSRLLFGTPREMTVEDISGPGGVVDQFVAGAKQSFDAGFKGVQLHAA
jgi:2,4-dienoyl-CoA reductase-like NADH-dependent reductase (Old Yellow Enzyme family)